MDLWLARVLLLCTPVEVPKYVSSTFDNQLFLTSVKTISLKVNYLHINDFNICTLFYLGPFYSDIFLY